jgi:glycosyltransferase involved in cell wall biosynthesis
VSPLVSVVVPTRDRLHLLPLALDSVVAQAGPLVRLQVIVADNGRDARVEALARGYGADYVATSAVGAGAVRNAGLELARGDYVAFLDDDDLWTPDHLSSHVALLERDRTLGASVSRMVLGDPQGRPGAWSPIPAGPPPEGSDLFGFFLSYFPSVCAVVARAEAVRDLGGFDERLLHAEDWDWNLRLAFRHRVGFVDRVTFIIRSRAWTPAESRIPWVRLGHWHRVFWKHVLRAGRRRPPLTRVLELYRRHSGMFAIWLCGCALHSLEAGRRGAALLRLSQAFLASPPHTLTWLARRLRGGQVRPRSSET